MQVDAAQYAEMSWEMLSTKSFLQLHCMGSNYLDKPPLLFWLNSISMAVFGINNFAAKFPSFLFALLAVYSTYRFAKIYYDEKLARIAALMLASSQAVFLITNDVRTDTMLMGSVIFSIWQFADFFESSKTKNLFLGALGLGLGLLAKGPIAVIATGAAIGPHLLWSRNWKKLFDFRLISVLLIVAVLLFPMCLGLYQQYGANGLRFYFWTQSFGRITGESEWNNHPDTFFLVHTSIWALAPWSLFFFVGWLRNLFVFIKNKCSLSSQTEIITLGGFTLTLISLMLSKYQLPHYIFVVYPLACIIAAKCFIDAANWKARHFITGLQLLSLLVLILISGFLQYAFKGFDLLSLACLILLYPLSLRIAIRANGGLRNFHSFIGYLYFRFNNFYNRVFRIKPFVRPSFVFGLDVLYRHLFALSLAVILVFNFLLSSFYFPEILKYQPVDDFGRYIKANAKNNFAIYHVVGDFAMVFYAQQKPDYELWSRQNFKETLKAKKELLVYATQYGLDELKADNIPYSIIEERETFPIAVMNFEFLNPATRHKACDKLYLLRVKD
jgi:4-amino-4-deoxy-L-arabinose transferase-like glycosyltransferase